MEYEYESEWEKRVMVELDGELRREGFYDNDYGYSDDYVVNTGVGVGVLGFFAGLFGGS